ncbi:MAG: hypothetical protein ACIAQZ_08575 [Sedimentisphaeraceae bacterium JB056]
MMLRNLLIVCTIAMAALMIGCKKEDSTPSTSGGEESSLMKMADEAGDAAGEAMEETKDVAEEAMDEAKDAAEEMKTDAQKMVCPKCSMPKDQCKCTE